MVQNAKRGRGNVRESLRAGEPQVSEPVWLEIAGESLVGCWERADEYAREQRTVRWEWGDDAWQAAALECLMMPGVWRHLVSLLDEQHRMGNAAAAQFYGMPRRGRFTGQYEGVPYELPGYELGSRTGGVVWCLVSHAGRAWDGVRREIDSELGYWLQVCGQELQRVQRGEMPICDARFVREQLAAYRVRVVPETQCGCDVGDA